MSKMRKMPKIIEITNNHCSCKSYEMPKDDEIKWNGSKWVKLQQNGSKWPKLQQNGPRSPKMGKVTKMVPNGSK